MLLLYLDVYGHTIDMFSLCKIVLLEETRHLLEFNTAKEEKVTPNFCNLYIKKFH